MSNTITAEQLAALEPGDTVTFTAPRTGWSTTEVVTGKVAKLTATQVVVHHQGPLGTVESRFRRDGGRKVGEGYGCLLDPEHPLTAATLVKDRREQRRRAIDALAQRWTRERDNLDLLRRLQVAVSEYLDAEGQS